MTNPTLDLWLIIKIYMCIYLYSIFKSVIRLDVEHVLLEVNLQIARGASI